MRVCVDFTEPSSLDLFNRTYMDRMTQIIRDKISEFELLRKAPPTVVMCGSDLFTVMKGADFYGIKLEEDITMSPWSLKIFRKEDENVHTMRSNEKD